MEFLEEGEFQVLVHKLCAVHKQECLDSSIWKAMRNHENRFVSYVAYVFHVVSIFSWCL